MKTILDPILNTIDGLLAWLGSSIGQLTENYCMLETAENETTLVGKDGSLVSIIKVYGAKYLVGPEEFDKIHRGITDTLQSAMSRTGHSLQIFFQHNKATVEHDLLNILKPSKQTAKRLNLQLDDLFEEKVSFLKKYCATEEMYLVLWTHPSSLTKVEQEQAIKNIKERNKTGKIPEIKNAQNILRGMPELRDTHHSFTQITLADLNSLGIHSKLLEVHEACRCIRMSVDPDFTDLDWSPSLPGDPIRPKKTRNYKDDISEILWPPLSKQLIPRDAENLNLRTARIGDRIYGSVFIDLFPKDIAPFIQLFRRLTYTGIPWRVSFMLTSNGLPALGLKPILSSFLSFASTDNKLLNNSVEYLRYLQNNTDDSLVTLQFTATTWAPFDDEKLLRSRTAELSKAIQSWGFCETSEISGDALSNVLSSSLGLSTNSVASVSVAPLSDAIYMIPLTRPASPWANGAVLFRSPDGKPWPYQPGSTLQTTWIDLIYARPGSGKSVLSNSINLALCLSPGIARLPRIAIIDIGPSSSGLISLVKSALPNNQKHLVAYHRLRMVPQMAINPFDTQLGWRFPSPQDRAFLVNFLSLLATPVGESKTYDGISDMAGMIVDELYKNLSDKANPHMYTSNLEIEIDNKIKELNISIDKKTSWWEITDALFEKGEIRLAHIAQRYAVPLLADAASICRTQTIADLYGEIIAPTGETLINAFGRMISSAVREYPILSKVTAFDLGESRVVSLDLDEVAKSGGAAADRQTAIMYMLARYILARHYYLTEDNVKEVPELYKEYHTKRVIEIREDPKRIVFDEFHRTSKSQAVRDQVIVDMREGRKWKVQVALLSQALDDFDPIMIDFATAIFIMDAGPQQAIDNSARVFGLSPTAKLALANRVHGPGPGGATFLAQFATKVGSNTQLITSTIGPIELWSFNTTAEDTRIRNALYEKIGPAETRKVLSTLYPSGSASKIIEERMAEMEENVDDFKAEQSLSIIDTMIKEIIEIYRTDPRFENIR